MTIAKNSRVNTPEGPATVLGHRTFKSGALAAYAVRLDSEPDRHTWYDPSAVTVNDEAGITRTYRFIGWHVSNPED